MIQFNQEKLDQDLASGKRLYIYYYLPGCGPCKNLTPKVEDVDLGDILEEDPSIYDQANDNYFSSLDYFRSNYIDRGLLSEREAGFYFYVIDNSEDTTERQRQKYDDLTDQVLTRGSEYLMEELERFYKDFQDENKGKRATIKEIADQFSDYYL